MGQYSNKVCWVFSCRGGLPEHQKSSDPATYAPPGSAQTSMVTTTPDFSSDKFILDLTGFTWGLDLHCHTEKMIFSKLSDKWFRHVVHRPRFEVSSCCRSSNDALIAPACDMISKARMSSVFLYGARSQNSSQMNASNHRSKTPDTHGPSSATPP